ncbi:unknown [Choristoneura fumiferana multiple nucleopolyhedrovirus]|uniref:Uncharacterized protein n=1 Tax=Choristoneura fumiferana nuclear polyhedrosis virus TaxID=208973 RepID=Q7TLS9_NPVCF|nr:unknown [Choristoneura fumiferana multiple nucleopolyhedrovirus]pir/S25836/ hypothetical protein 1 - Choristoneura fumiferana nuclear polyhedrosis virus [Choristoneura fumiferana multiple nucleopolyhedrovirus]AAP29850.1 unknown [Choristoneura fumiferana multiple nucleopolyhedrovirus]
MITTSQKELKTVQETVLDLSIETDDFLKNKIENTQLEERLIKLAMRANKITFEQPQELMKLNTNTLNCINILVDLILLKINM